MAASDLAFVNAKEKWAPDEGDFRFQIGNVTDKVTCGQTKIWDSPKQVTKEVEKEISV
jgi:beta-glucosidase